MFPAALRHPCNTKDSRRDATQRSVLVPLSPELGSEVTKTAVVTLVVDTTDFFVADMLRTQRILPAKAFERDPVLFHVVLSWDHQNSFN
jgi:hypothetical protein